jgi:hypothetical protein
MDNMKGFLPVITLVVGLIGGLLIAGSNPQISEDEHSHDGDSHMTHEIRNVEGLAPSVDLVLHEVSDGEYVAQILATNFKISPLSVSGEDVYGEGHAHIYIDGEKINRVLGEWYNLGKLEGGDHQVSVRLSSNDHHELAVENKIITDVEHVSVGHADEMEDAQPVRGDSAPEMNVE